MHHRWHRFNFSLERGIGCYRVFPNLIRIRSEIDIRLVIAVENPRLFVVQVEHGPLVLILEKRLVRSHHLGIVAEARPNPSAKPDQAFDPIGRQKGIAQNVPRLLADAVHAPGPLNQADNGPRQIVIYDYGAVLQILPLAEHVGCDQHPQLAFGRAPVRLVIALWAEPPREFRRVRRAPSRGGHLGHAACL